VVESGNADVRHVEEQCSCGIGDMGLGGTGRGNPRCAGKGTIGGFSTRMRRVATIRGKFHGWAKLCEH